MKNMIIYQQKNGSIALISPIKECGLTVEEIASKDVPEGSPYLIVEEKDLPSDITFLEAWEADFSKPDGYGIGHKKWFAARGIKI
jgi:hypothetical protein